MVSNPLTLAFHVKFCELQTPHPVFILLAMDALVTTGLFHIRKKTGKPPASFL